MCFLSRSPASVTSESLSARRALNMLGVQVLSSSVGGASGAPPSTAAVLQSKTGGPAPLRLDEQGREVDEQGRPIERRPAAPALKVAISSASRRRNLPMLHLLQERMLLRHCICHDTLALTTCVVLHRQISKWSLLKILSQKGQKSGQCSLPYMRLVPAGLCCLVADPHVTVSCKKEGR